MKIYNPYSNAGNMLITTYDPAGGGRQVAFADQLPDITGLVPYTGASGDITLGTHSIVVGGITINSNNILIATANTPATSSATGTTGMISWDANYIYVCVTTNTWKRTSITTW